MFHRLIVYRLIPFALAGFLGIICVFLVQIQPALKSQDDAVESSPGQAWSSNDLGTASSGADFGSGMGPGCHDIPEFCSAGPTKSQQISFLRITGRPKAQYTHKAREHGIQGIVVLRVVFSTKGRPGEIQVVKGLPYGLTEQAIIAAKRLTFEPKKIDGRPVPITLTIGYDFAI